MHRFTITVDDEMYQELENISEKNRHSLNTTVHVLLQYALKEKSRKRHGKKVHISDNAANPR